MTDDLIRPHEAARTYASVAAVLAGFCFAAVVLVVTVNIEAANGGSPAATARFKDALADALSALMAAFVGLVMSSFLMARVGGRPGVYASIDDPNASRERGSARGSPRAFWLVLLASSGLATSALFALWGLAKLVGRVPGQDGEVVTTVWVVFVATSLLAAAFVAAAAFDLRTAALEDSAPTWREQAGAWRQHATVTAWALRDWLNSSRDTQDWLAHSEEALAHRLMRIRKGLTAEHRLRRETTGLVCAGLGGGTLLFFAVAGFISVLDEFPTSTTPLTILAYIYLAVFTVFLIAALAFSSSSMADVPRWLRAGRGAAIGYFVVAAPVAVAWALVLRLPITG